MSASANEKITPIRTADPLIHGWMAGHPDYWIWSIVRLDGVLRTDLLVRALEHAGDG